ncbi:hypothetical protein B0H13DRAFT_2025713 [Mycena leptocephala]|nr:hypothetical protein B0H13DRAFT_2025713 [Mycena leptocephala]
MYVHSRKPLLSGLAHTLSLAMIDGFICNVGHPYVVGSPHASTFMMSVPMSPLWFARTCHYCSASPPVHGVSPSSVSLLPRRLGMTPARQRPPHCFAFPRLPGRIGRKTRVCVDCPRLPLSAHDIAHPTLQVFDDRLASDRRERCRVAAITADRLYSKGNI